MKEFGQPKKEEIEKYQQFIDKVLWGGLQYSDGPNNSACARVCSITLRRTCPD